MAKNLLKMSSYGEEERENYYVIIIFSMCEVFFFNDFQTSNVEKKKLYTYIIIVCVYVKRGKFRMFQTFQELYPLIFKCGFGLLSW